VVIFSHGLGGSREGSVYLGEHWSNAGYLVVAIQHPGSDESIWKNLPRWKIAQAMKEAASLESFLNRINDVRTVIDYLEESNDKQTHPLHRKLDTKHIALAGHSFGAVTTQAFMGQNFFRGGDQTYGDPRIDCFILMSPSQSKKLSNKSAFGEVTKPVLCMTGTKDKSPLRPEVTPETRKQVYISLPAGSAYQVVFHKGSHSIFGDYRKNDPRYHAAIKKSTTEFLDAYLKKDTAAESWLRSEKARECLVDEDIWEWK
jgi:dienelactone hydrolase